MRTHKLTSLLLAFLLVLTACDPAVAGLWGKRPKPSTTVIENMTLIPDSTYYFPPGLQQDEDSWYNAGDVGTAPSIYSFGLRVDSVAGFDADSSVLTIEPVFGYESTTDTVEYIYGDDNIAIHWYIWNDTTTILARTDLGRLINSGLPAHERRRYKVTVIDTLKVLEFKETPAKP